MVDADDPRSIYGTTSSLRAAAARTRTRDDARE
eukprot:CAMPEP_0185186608 /NCGR_PEP_ID=MMETSP1140-20130426/4172_1 /TAXON_ID=298111 /ORGANISM="Pavlova sp., Strain CCMP459" /LENGTH=32 /DNA_ID= /DNA_START= /DNA_END= /DNA_ORIENTATION=